MDVGMMLGFKVNWKLYHYWTLSRLRQKLTTGVNFVCADRKYVWV